MYSGPARGGTRGGKDKFNWDDVKNDQYRYGRCLCILPEPANDPLTTLQRRENYLGHSLHGQIGRWTTTARGRDLTWWSEGRSQLNRYTIAQQPNSQQPHSPIAP